MSETDLLQDAVAELYSADPDQFVERRGALVAAARGAGQAPVARQIAGLRKPTRSAWVVNQLARTEPGFTSELTSLGEELRSAQESLNGAAIRELSQRRHRLIETLTRRAFELAGQPQPPAALRDEVTATLGAALADPEVAAQLASGTLARPARSEGFGPAGPGGAPELALVTSSGARGPSRTPRAPGPRRTQTTTETGTETGTASRAQARARRTGPARPAPSAAEQAEAEQARAEQARAERERRRQADLAVAEQAADEAGRLAEAATVAEHELERTVQTLEEQLADARRSLSETRNQARRARNRQRQAGQALDRLRG